LNSSSTFILGDLNIELTPPDPDVTSLIYKFSPIFCVAC